MNTFTAHINRKQRIYQTAMAAESYSQVFIASGSRQYQFRDDIDVPFIACAYFREWLPLLFHPDSFLLVSETADRPTLFLKVVEDYWHSTPEPLADVIAMAVNLMEYATAEDLSRQLILTGKSAFIGDSGAIPQGLVDVDINPEKLLNHIDYHRAWKSDYEMDNMREANRMAIRGHRAAEQAFREGCSEYEIHMTYLSAVGCREEELPYSNIVALNGNTAILHHMTLGRQRPGQNQSFLIDAGAQFNGYASDITRTYIKEGGNDSFAALIAGADTLQQRLVANLKPGIDYSDLHIEAHRQIAELLVELNIIKISSEEAVKAGLTNAFFPHGLGHLIGAQVHDKGGQLASANGDHKAPPKQHPFLRCTKTVDAGMAFTIEPGIYFIPLLLEPWREKSKTVNWPLVDQLLPYGGIRIEDNVIVHTDRVENMTRDAFSVQSDITKNT